MYILSFVARLIYSIHQCSHFIRNILSNESLHDIQWILFTQTNDLRMIWFGWNNWRFTDSWQMKKLFLLWKWSTRYFKWYHSFEPIRAFIRSPRFIYFVLLLFSILLFWSNYSVYYGSCLLLWPESSFDLLFDELKGGRLMEMQEAVAGFAFDTKSNLWL